MNVPQAGRLGGLHGQRLLGKKNIREKFNILIIFIFFFIEYYAYVFEIMLKYMDPENFYLILILLIVFHLLVLLLLTSFISTMLTNPGEIPLNWGFNLGDDDSKRKRWCQICNVFKPERSHHCSVCNKCVLNMNFHCPWVNNCIGFYNRKFYMLLLFFVLILVIYVDITEGYLFYDICMKLFKKNINYNEINHIGFVIICYIAILVFTFIMLRCTIFQLKLVLLNSTLIESLDQMHKIENKKFNVGYRQNWEQVFGKELLLWFFPFPTTRGKPEGDGLTWKIKEE